MVVYIVVELVVLVLERSRPSAAFTLGVGGGGGGGLEGEIEKVVRRHLRWLVTSAECGGGRGGRRGGA